MKYKKIFALIISLVLVWGVSITTFAAKEATVYISDVNADPGGAIFIPIQIKNNPGIMGFRVTVGYDAKSLIPRAVTRGSVTEIGSFENSVGSSEDTSIDIVWNNTEEVKKDGTLAVVGFTCLSKAKDKINIELSYTQKDTFNEKYEDVVFDCKGGMIDFSGEAVTNERTDKREVTSEDIVLAVEAVQGDPQITPTKAVMDSVNSLLSQITGDPESYFSSPDEITPAYIESTKESFIKDTVNKVEPERVAEIIQNALELTGADSVGSIPEDRKVDFVNNVESGLKEELPDVKELSDYISRDDEVIVLSGLLEEANEEIAKSNSPLAKISGSFSRYRVFWIICVAGVIIILVLIFLIIHGKSRRKNKNHSNRKK
ncbi:MAG: hypothetical protein K6B52_02235 [Clostridiales bacterium]|nr:hypothetical protein [Clostridiales bacterium]